MKKGDDTQTSSLNELFSAFTCHTQSVNPANTPTPPTEAEVSRDPPDDSIEQPGQANYCAPPQLHSHSYRLYAPTYETLRIRQAVWDGAVIPHAKRTPPRRSPSPDPHRAIDQSMKGHCRFPPTIGP
jgi:hypothetical protein